MHLKMHVDGDLSYPKPAKQVDEEAEVPCPKTDIAAWKRVLDDIMPLWFTGLQTLNLSIYIQGYPSCYRQSQGRKFSAMFQSLRPLRLKEFTVIMNQNIYTDCDQRLHDNDAHDRDKQNMQNLKPTFFQRKELMRIWAEEIREVVLGKK